MIFTFFFAIFRTSSATINPCKTLYSLSHRLLRKTLAPRSAARPILLDPSLKAGFSRSLATPFCLTHSPAALRLDARRNQRATHVQSFEPGFEISQPSSQIKPHQRPKRFQVKVLRLMRSRIFVLHTSHAYMCPADIMQ